MSECTLRRCISDCAHALPALLCIRDVLEPSLSYALYQTRDGNLKLWCVVQHYEEHITTYLGYGCVLCHNPALEYRPSTGQYWYMSLPCPNAAHIYIYLNWTPFSAQTLEQRHLSTRLHSSHASAEICSEWLLDLEQLLMANSNPWGFKGHWYLLM